MSMAFFMVTENLRNWVVFSAQVWTSWVLNWQ